MTKIAETGVVRGDASLFVTGEARIQSSLAHDNVVRIFGIAVEERPGVQPKFRIVLARLQEPLSKLLARVASGASGPPDQALPLAWRLNALHEIASGLAHLHANRVVHGDLKPANVMLTSARTGCVLQLSDFGLASEASTLLNTVNGGGGGRTSLGGVGTVTWMAPELLAAPVPGGRPERPRYRTDVYAWATLGWQVLAVSPAAYPGFNDEQVRDHVRNGGRPDLSELPDGLPAPLPILLACGWSAAPSDRPRSGGELLEALREASPPAAPPPLPPALMPSGGGGGGGGGGSGAAAGEGPAGEGSFARAPELAEWRPGLVVPECPLCAERGVHGVDLGCAAGHALCMECILRTIRLELAPGSTMVRCPCCRVGPPPPADVPVAEAAVAEVAAWSASAAREAGAALGALRPLGADELARFARIEAARRAREEAARRAETEAALPEGAFKRCPGHHAGGAPCGEGIQHPRGHACHHIKPGGGCPSCGSHFCYTCLAPYDGGCPNGCPLFCNNECDCPDCLECSPGRPCDECDNDGRCWVCQPDRRPPPPPTPQEQRRREQAERAAAEQVNFPSNQSPPRPTSSL